MQLLPWLNKLVLERCHKLSALLPPQLGHKAIRLKELQLGHVHNLKWWRTSICSQRSL
jgi:hypothetical protein